MPEGFTHQSRQPREIREGSVFTLTRPSVPDTPESSGGKTPRKAAKK